MVCGGCRRIARRCDAAALGTRKTCIWPSKMAPRSASSAGTRGSADGGAACSGVQPLRGARQVGQRFWLCCTQRWSQFLQIGCRQSKGLTSARNPWKSFAHSRSHTPILFTRLLPAQRLRNFLRRAACASSQDF